MRAFGFHAHERGRSVFRNTGLSIRLNAPVVSMFFVRICMTTPMKTLKQEHSMSTLAAAFAGFARAGRGTAVSRVRRSGPNAPCEAPLAGLSSGEANGLYGIAHSQTEHISRALFAVRASDSTALPRGQVPRNVANSPISPFGLHLAATCSISTVSNVVLQRARLCLVCPAATAWRTADYVGTVVTLLADNSSLRLALRRPFWGLHSKNSFLAEKWNEFFECRPFLSAELFRFV